MRRVSAVINTRFTHGTKGRNLQSTLMHIMAVAFAACALALGAIAFGAGEQAHDVSVALAAAAADSSRPDSGITRDTDRQPERAAPRAQADLVEFEKMTWVEVKAALAAGKTTALIYTGGTEQRGPHLANGYHNLVAHAQVEAIARELGNALFMPVLPYTPNDAEALPGTIGITNELLAAMLERITEESILNGFRNVILMGDHGGGQPQVYEEVAKKLDRRYRPHGIRVFYCDQVYRAANDAFDQYLAQNGYPPGLHGYLYDTSQMMYLDKDNTWVRRDLVSSAVGDPVVDGKVQIGPQSPHNGILGDARRSTAELGKRAFDLKVDYAVRQIRRLLAGGY